MNDNVKKYSWQFFRYFIVGYIVGFAMILSAALLIHVRLDDIILVFVLCLAVSNSIAMNFIKAEKRYFDELELRSMIKRTSFMALSISIIPSVLYLGYCIFLKLLFTPEEITALLTNANIPTNDMINDLLKMNSAMLFAVLLGAIALYYLIVRAILGWHFRLMGRRYTKISAK